MGGGSANSPGGDRALIEAHLARLDAEELARRLLAVADRHEGLWVGLVAEARATSGTLVVGELKKELTGWLRVSSRHLSWHGSREYAQSVDGALDLLDGLLAAGHGEPVVALAEHVIKRLDGAMSRIDDSGGFLGLPVTRVAGIHLRACAGECEECFLDVVAAVGANEESAAVVEPGEGAFDDPVLTAKR